MEIGSKIKEGLDALKEFIENQKAYQSLVSKWEDLEPKNKQTIRLAGIGCFLCLGSLTFFFSLWSVHRLKKELIEEKKLLQTLQSANDEMGELQSRIPSESNLVWKDNGPWPAYFEKMATLSGIEKASLAISEEKLPNNSAISSDLAKESLFEVHLKHVNLKQVVRYAFYLENNLRPVKLRNLLVDTNADSTGYMDASLLLSAFTLMEPK